ncbi:uncharacterized protein TM35_000282150 [Trypanosoma theileri]|uniref:Uncharacterized protein n=1 Tax=Trypanosoma theileri TaxID=67003 RepID=A0A1X0NQP1_9TRYP|nr:uncharacterized protein TM35_000282150 [Trypanosoma theileri]ORC86499.1 hypothetical protein TM35_000282150 [Trypanosoma theileri]
MGGAVARPQPKRPVGPRTPTGTTSHDSNNSSYSRKYRNNHYSNNNNSGNDIMADGAFNSNNGSVGVSTNGSERNAERRGRRVRITSSVVELDKIPILQSNASIMFSPTGARALPPRPTTGILSKCEYDKFTGLPVVSVPGSEIKSASEVPTPPLPARITPDINTPQINTSNVNEQEGEGEEIERKGNGQSRVNNKEDAGIAVTAAVRDQSPPTTTATKNANVDEFNVVNKGAENYSSPLSDLLKRPLNPTSNIRTTEVTADEPKVFSASSSVTAASELSEAITELNSNGNIVPEEKNSNNSTNSKSRVRHIRRKQHRKEKKKEEDEDEEKKNNVMKENNNDPEIQKVSASPTSLIKSFSIEF